MINKYNLTKALIDKAKEIADLNGYSLIVSGSTYEPEPDEPYNQVFTLYGDDSALGIEDSSSDLQLGIFQINVHTPKSWKGAEWQGLTVCDSFVAGFSRGTELVHSGQMVRIKTTSISQVTMNDTHMTHVLSISYSVVK